MAKQMWMWFKSIIVSLALMAAVVFGASLSGYHLYEVKTPSMSPTIPVGSLIFVKAQQAYGINDIVTFRTTNSDTPYTHRIIEVGKDTVKTKGDANGSSDPWATTYNQIEGKVSLTIPAGGYFARMYLMMSVMMLIVLASLQYMSEKWRKPVALVGSALSFAVASFVVRPWVNASMTGTSQMGESIDASMVSTGVLPIKIKSNISGIVLDYGQRGILTGTAQDSSGLVTFHPNLSLNFWQWVLVALFCCLPLFISFKWAITEDKKMADTRSYHRSLLANNRHAKYVAPLGASMVILCASFILSTQSVMVAQIINNRNKAAMMEYYSCEGAALSEFPEAVIVWPLSENDGATIVEDRTPEKDNGQYSGTRYLTANTACARDKRAASSFNGSNTCAISKWDYHTRNEFSLEAWFRTETGAGRILGFAATDGKFDDRFIYIDSTGQVGFYTEPGNTGGSQVIVRSPGKYLDNQWHHVVATLGPSGQKLYIDGKLVDSDANTRARSNYTGGTAYLKAGCGNTNSVKLPSRSKLKRYYSGNLQWASYYSEELDANTIAKHYNNVR